MLVIALLLCAQAPVLPGAVEADEAPAGLSPADWSGIRAAYEAGKREVRAVEGGHEACHPGQRWRTFFDGRAFLTRPDSGKWTWGLELRSYGFGEQRREARLAQSVCVEGPRLTYDWDTALREWYVNDARGLEHGYTVVRRPSPTGRGPLVIDLAVRGELRPVVSDEGRDVRFVDERGTTALTYAGLTVFDAEGKLLPARMEPTTSGLCLIVDERGATYPLTIDPVAQQAYLKASNTGPDDAFGTSVAVSGDTVLVGAKTEDSDATGIDGDQNNDNATDSGAVYVFVRNGGTWSQQAYLKSSNSEAGDLFGTWVTISGNTAVVGAVQEGSSATGVNGDQNDNGRSGSGAAYVFVRSGSTWTQQAYLKASNTGLDDQFGFRVALEDDTLVVTAHFEDSDATGVNGDQNNDLAVDSGAAYVFVRNGTAWTQEAYLKPSNTGANDLFGFSTSISRDTVVVGSKHEASAATGVNGDESDDTAPMAGAAYVFVRNGTTWSQEAYLKASNTDGGDLFGGAVAISGDTIITGAQGEQSNATTVNGNQSDDSLTFAGAGYVFVRNGTTWTQEAYIKTSNAGASDHCGISVEICGNTLVLGAKGEGSNATGIDGDQGDNSYMLAGAVYVFTRTGTTWGQVSYIKATNTGDMDQFGRALGLSHGTLVVGAMAEDSSATGVDGNQNLEDAGESGAAYVFEVPASYTNVILPAALPGDPALDDIGGTATIGPAINDATEVFDLSLDCSGMASGGAYTIVLRTGHQATPLATSFGDLWLAGTTLVKSPGVHAQNVVTWGAIVLPNDPAFVGIEYTAQGFCGQNGGGSRLSSGIVQQIGI